MNTRPEDSRNQQLTFHPFFNPLEWHQLGSASRRTWQRCATTVWEAAHEPRGDGVTAAQRTHGYLR